jgi:gliding motility-associated-like protein
MNSLKKNRWSLVLFIISVLAIESVFSQTQFVLTGIPVAATSNLGGGCYRITRAVNNDRAIATNLYAIDLGQSFSLAFTMNFGTKDNNGADGMCFLIGNACSPAPGTGGLIGIPSSANPSIFVEFDTWDNGAGSNDIPEDHITIQRNGSLAPANSLTGAPVSARATAPFNIEDGLDHNVIINWIYNSPTSQTIEVYFDGSLRKSATGDFITLMGGNLNYWSITGSTGGSNNVQSFCYAEVNQNQTQSCVGGTFVFTAPPRAYPSTTYTWTSTPASNYTVSASPGISIIAKPVQTTTYTCTYKDFCNVTRTVAFNAVIQNTVPKGTIAGSTTVCMNSASPSITFTKTAGTSPLSFFYKVNGGATQTVIASGTSTTVPVPTNVAGTFTYSLVSIVDGSGSSCTNDTIIGGSSTIVIEPLPTAIAGGSQSVCPNGDITVIGATATNGSILWTEDGAGSIISGATTLTPTYRSVSGDASKTVVLTMTVTSTNSCSPQKATATYSVVVNPDASINLTSGSSSQRVCINNSINNVVYTIGGGATGVVLTGAPAGVILATSGNVYTLQNAPTIAGVFDYSLTTTGTCLQTVAVGSFTVEELPLLSSSLAPPAVCTDNSFIYTATSSDPVNVFSWSRKALPEISGGGANSNYSVNTPNINEPLSLTNKTLASVDVLYTYTLTTDVCVNTQTITVNVMNNGAIGLTSGLTPDGKTSTDAQSLCPNDVIAPITYSINSGVTSATITGLPAGVTYTVTSGDPGLIEVSGAVGNVNAVYVYTITTSGSCIQPSPVTGKFTIGLSLVEGSTNQRLCEGQIGQRVVFAVGGRNKPVDNSNPFVLNLGDAEGSVQPCLPCMVPGLTTTFDTISRNWVLEGVPTMAGSYSLTITHVGCGTPPYYSQSGTLVVGAGGLSPGYSNEVNSCKGNPMQDIIYDIDGGKAIVTGLPAGVTAMDDTPNPGQVLISGTPTVEGLFTYTLVGLGAGCTVEPMYGTIAVGASLEGDNNQRVCLNESITDIKYTRISGGAAATATITGLPPGVTYSATAADEITITGASTSAGIFPYTLTLQGTCALQSIFTGTLTVGAASTTPGIDTQDVCECDPIQPISYTFVGGFAQVSGLPAGITYSVTSPGYLTISGGDCLSGVYNYTVSTLGTCNPNEVNLFGRITIGGGLVTSGGSNIQTVCKNSAITDIKYKIVGGVANVTGLPSDFPTPTLNVTNDTLTISGASSLEGIYNYTVSTSGGSCGTPSYFYGTITIGGGLVTSGGSNVQAVCKNSSITDIKYKIEGGVVSVTGLPSDFPTPTLNFSNDTLTISGSSLLEGIYNYTVSTSGGVCGTPSYFYGTITIGGGIVTSGGSNIQAVCENIAIADIKYKIVGGVANVTGLPSDFPNPMMNVSNDTLTISGSSLLEGIYNYTVSTSGGVCGIPSYFYGTITIGGGIVTSGGSNIQAVCENIAITDIKYKIVGGVANVTGLPSDFPTPTLNVSNDTLTISGSSLLEGIYNYTVSTSGGACGTPSYFYGTITIGGGIVTSGGSNIQAVCENTAITDIKYKIVGGVANVTGLPSDFPTPTLNLSNDTLTISGSSSLEGIYNYTVTTSGGACGTPSYFYGTITIGGGLVTSGGSNIQAVCENIAITDIKYKIVGGVANVTGLPSDFPTPTLNVSNDTLTISGASLLEGIYNYTVSTLGGACGTPSYFYGTITIGGGLVTSGGSNIQAVCKNTPITDIKYKIVGGVASVIGLPSDFPTPTMNVSNDTLTISGASLLEGIYNYTVSTLGGSCGTPSYFYGTITIGGGLVTSGGSNEQAVCKNIAITDIKYKIVGLYANTYGLPSDFPAPTLNITDDTLTIAGSSALEGIYNYTVTTSGGICNDDSSAFYGTLTIGGGLISSGGSNEQTVCKGNSISPIKYKIVGGAADAYNLPDGVFDVMNSTNDTLTISGTPTAGGIYNYTVSTINGTCGVLNQSNFMGVITSNEVTISITSAVATENQSVCEDLPITDITYNVTSVVGVPTIGIAGLITPDNYIYNNTSNSLTIFGNVPEGLYEIRVNGSCNTVTANFNIERLRPIAAFTASPDTGEPPLLVNFTNNSTGANSYTWNFGDGNVSNLENPINTFNAEGIYTVTLIASTNSTNTVTPVCVSYETVVVSVYKLIIPNVFTPNNDGVNDVFSINSIGAAKIEGEVFNKWGIKLYDWKPSSLGWDGRNSNTSLECPSGTYYYIFRITDINNQTNTYKGFILLLR